MAKSIKYSRHIKYTLKLLWIVILVAMSISSCKKKKDVTIEPPTLIKIKINNVVNGSPLFLNTGIYINENGDTFSVTKYRYFISNISLATKTGMTHYEQDSYHLVDQSIDSSRSIVIEGLPEGDYTSISFLIGVDSVKNVSGAQEGDLNPGTGMFWDWNSGYVMAMFEGTSPSSPENTLLFHTGGFSGNNNTLRWVTLQLPDVATVIKNKQPVIYLSSDVGEWFKTPNVIDFSKLYINNGGKNAVLIADNYADMFKVEHVD